VNDEFKRCRRARSWPNFKVHSQHLPASTEENHENLSQNSRSPGLDLNPGRSWNDPSLLKGWILEDGVKMKKHSVNVNWFELRDPTLVELYISDEPSATFSQTD
jgi:hypothetical protein